MNSRTPTGSSSSPAARIPSSRSSGPPAASPSIASSKSFTGAISSSELKMMRSTSNRSRSIFMTNKTVGARKKYPSIASSGASTRSTASRLSRGGSAAPAARARAIASKSQTSRLFACKSSKLAASGWFPAS